MPINPADYASASALVRGVEARLRSADVFDDQPGERVGKYVGVQPAPGRPPRSMGQWYCAVHWKGGRGDSPIPEYWATLQGVVVTLTARLNYAPGDRKGIRLATAGDVYDLACAIAGPDVVHGNKEVLTAANALIPGTEEYVAVHGGDATVNGFSELLVLGPFGPEREAPPGWLGEGKTDDVYVVTIEFRDARHERPYSG